MLSSPWTFVQILQQAIVRGVLGDELRAAVHCGTSGREDTLRRYLRPNALVSTLLRPTRVIGRALPRDHRLYHDYRVGNPTPADGQAQS